ncbi:cation transporter, partial [Candidatus Bipolaricaulota bacterium]|nr:cation transporter [Candidatus Bipolaricaulota bacterium]
MPGFLFHCSSSSVCYRINLMDWLFPKTNPPSDSGVRVTLVGIVINVLLLAAKLIAGFLTGSVALVADGIHSGSDMATDLVVLGAIRLGARKPDASHPYGHGRYETLAGGLLAVTLIVVGLFIAWKAGRALYAHQRSFPGLAVLVVAACSILTKEWIYRKTARVARRVRSTALHANAWHHRSDALSSVAVLLGGVVGLCGWGYADQVAGLLVGLMVVSSGGKTLFNVLHELTEGALSPAQLHTINAAIKQVDQVRGWHQLRTRQVGREIFLDLHVLVDPDLTLLEGHRISMQVEEVLQAACKRPVNVMVH